jgi:hypothetical protein
LIEFLRSPTGGAVVVAIAVSVLAAVLVWARAPNHAERQLLVGTAAAVTGALAIIYVIAVAAGWWMGEYFLLPAFVQAAILLPISLAGCTLWLAAYGWATERSARPLWMQLAISILVIAAVAVAHLLNLGRGAVLVGPGWTIVYEALAGLALLWAPVLIYEALRQALRRAELLP